MTQTRAAAILIAALLYALLPTDLVPDFLPLIGWLDDFLAVGLAGYLLWRNWKGRLGGRTPPGSRARVVDADSEERADSEDDPYAVLGVPPGASKDEIKQAYRARVAEYHPDKVAHLGPELRRLAEQKTLAIRRAYERLSA